MLSNVISDLFNWIPYRLINLSDYPLFPLFYYLILPLLTSLKRSKKYSRSSISKWIKLWIKLRLKSHAWVDADAAAVERSNGMESDINLNVLVCVCVWVWCKTHTHFISFPIGKNCHRSCYHQCHQVSR